MHTPAVQVVVSYTHHSHSYRPHPPRRDKVDTLVQVVILVLVPALVLVQVQAVFVVVDNKPIPVLTIAKVTYQVVSLIVVTEGMAVNLTDLILVLDHTDSDLKGKLAVAEDEVEAELLEVIFVDLEVDVDC